MRRRTSPDVYDSRDWHKFTNIRVSIVHCNVSDAMNDMIDCDQIILPSSGSLTMRHLHQSMVLMLRCPPHVGRRRTRSDNVQ